MTSPNSTTAASFVAAQEIVRCGKPFMDGEYMKECFINVSEQLFSNKEERQKISLVNKFWI